MTRIAVNLAKSIYQGYRKCPFRPDDSAQATEPRGVQAIYTGAGRTGRVGDGYLWHSAY